MLLVGSTDRHGGSVAELPAAAAWMAGRGAPGDGGADLTGVLLLASSLEQVATAVGPGCGASKKAQQPGRTICTVPRGAVGGIGCTLAFITDSGPTPLFTR
jgi:hypothetical protein